MEAGMPGSFTSEIDQKTDSAIAVVRSRSAVNHVGGQGPLESVVFITADQLRLSLVPPGRDVSLAHHAFCLHLKNVGEIGAQRDLEGKPGSLHAVVKNVQIFVNAVMDSPAEDEVEGARLDVAVFGADERIREISS